MQSRRWPHFMEKRSTYRSNKSLGVLYDKVAKHTKPFLPSASTSFDRGVLQRHETDDAMLASARAIKAEYDVSVKRILVQHDVATEFELYTSWAMSKPRIGSDYKRQEDLGREYDVLKQRFRERCYAAVGGADPAVLDPFVVAMYKVTEEEVMAHTDGVPMISFPWIFHWVMIRLAMGDRYKPGKSILSAERRVPKHVKEMKEE